MQRIVFAAIVGVFVLAGVVIPGVLAQGQKPPVAATDVLASEIRAVIDSPVGGGDRLIKAIDIGDYNQGIGVLKRGPTKPGAPVGAIMHEHITETYYVVSGSGTLLTGGTVVGAKPTPADSEIVKVAVGASMQGTFDKPAQRRRISQGDMVIIPPGVYHGFDEVTTGIEYVSVRTDPKHVLPAGYVHPAIKK